MNVQNINTLFKQHQAKEIRKNNLKKYAVLVPVVEIDGELHFIFQVRSSSLKKQPGDVCFPGGKIEATDPSFKDAAVRETCEEMGLKPSKIKNIHALDFIVDTQEIYPFIAEISNIDEVKINKEEVSEIFTIPLSFLLTTAPQKHTVNLKVEPEPDFPYHLIAAGKN